MCVEMVLLSLLLSLETCKTFCLAKCYHFDEFDFSDLNNLSRLIDIQQGHQILTTIVFMPLQIVHESQYLFCVFKELWCAYTVPRMGRNVCRNGLIISLIIFRDM